MKLKRKNEVHLFNHFINTTIIKPKFEFRLRRWYQQNQEFDPVFREIFKFKPTGNLFKWRRFMGILGFMTAVNGYLILEKIYQVDDDYYIRDPGSVVPYELPFTYCLVRIIKFNIHLWTLTNIWVGFRIGEGRDYPMGEQPADQVLLMRLQQWEHYMKRRDNSFDFLMIGEQEDVPLD